MKNSVLQANQLASKSPRPVAESVPDFAVSHHGTVSLFHPLTNRAHEWLALHCAPSGEHQYLGDALAVEHRFVSGIVAQAQLDGLKPPQPGKEGRQN